VVFKSETKKKENDFLIIKFWQLSFTTIF